MTRALLLMVTLLLVVFGLSLIAQGIGLVELAPEEETDGHDDRALDQRS